MHSIQDSADFIFADPSCTVRCNSEDESLEHGLFSAHDVKAMALAVLGCSEARGFEHLFCSTLHIAHWYKALLKDSKQEDIVHDDREYGLEKSETRVSPVF